MSLDTVVDVAPGPLVAVAVLIIIAIRATGRARSFGLIGSVFLLIGSLASSALSLSSGVLVRTFHLTASTYGLLTVPALVLNSIGLILIALAIASRARATTSAP